MPDLWSDLLGCLDLRPHPVADRRDAGDVFEGRNLRLNYRRLFGGQILGQFVQAAGRACPDKTIKSLHALFAKEGRYTEPVRYEVTPHHEGRSFATVTIVAGQSAAVIASASVSMHAVEDGPEYQTIADVPPLLTAEHKVDYTLIPWDTRSRADLDATTASPPEFELWMRTPEVDQKLAPALTAYATDLNLIGTALRPVEGISQTGNGTAFTSAVTSHSVWFHRPFRTDEWLLLRQHSPLVAHGRCFGRGDLLTEDGSLVASYAQEALLRFQEV
jgi:acyl-CoA thioesterase-2